MPTGNPKTQWSALHTVAAGLAASTAIFCAAMYVDSADGLPQRLPPEAHAMRSLEVMWHWYCQEKPVGFIAGTHCVFGAPWQSAPRKTMIWGDSNAQHFAPIIEAINADPERSFLLYASFSVVLGDEFNIAVPQVPDWEARTRRWYQAGVKLLKEDAAIDEVVFASNWLDLPARIGRGNAEEGLEAMRRALTKIISETSIPDRRFTLIGTIPHIPQKIVECAITRSSTLLRRPCVAELQPSEALSAKRDSLPIDQMFKDVAKSARNVTAVIPTENLCTDDTCDVYLNGEFIYRDHSHLRRNLSPQTMRGFAEKIGLTHALPPSRPGN